MLLLQRERCVQLAERQPPERKQLTTPETLEFVAVSEQGVWSGVMVPIGFVPHGRLSKSRSCMWDQLGRKLHQRMD